jgi:hypothetical protein
MEGFPIDSWQDYRAGHGHSGTYDAGVANEILEKTGRLKARSPRLGGVETESGAKDEILGSRLHYRDQIAS